MQKFGISVAQHRSGAVNIANPLVKAVKYNGLMFYQEHLNAHFFMERIND